MGICEASRIYPHTPAPAAYMRTSRYLVVTLLVTVPLALACAGAQSSHPTTTTVSPTTGKAVTAPAKVGVYTGLTFRVMVTIAPNNQFQPGYPAVRHVDAGSPGDKAGLKIGDQIITINGVDQRTNQTALALGTTYTLLIRRGKDEREVLLTPAPPRTDTTRTEHR